MAPGTTEPPPPEEFVKFERLLKRLLAVPKREVDRRIAAFKARKKKRRRS